RDARIRDRRQSVLRQRREVARPRGAVRRAHHPARDRARGLRRRARRGDGRMTVLVTAASRHGGTAEIAAAIGRVLRERDVDVEPIVSTVAPEAHRVFGGRVDRSRLALAERAILRAVRAREGDYRDWRAIRGYAQEIAETVSA